MNTIAICNPCIKKELHDGIFESLEIDGEIITIGLIDVPDIQYKKYLDSHSILVRINAFSCNFRDRAILHSFHDVCTKKYDENKLFFSPIGSEFVGIVEKVGSDVFEFKIGDRVMPNHSYPYKSNGQFGGVISNFASQRLQMFNEAELIKVPDKMSDEEAASFSLSAQTAYSMVRKANVKKGDNVLVTSCSSNTSLAVLEILCNFDCNIYAASTNVGTIKELLADKDIQEIVDLRTLKSNKSALPPLDAVIDPFIDINLKYLIPYINYNARYVYCGVYKQSSKYDYSNYTNLDSLEIYTLCMIKNASLIGNCLGLPMDLQEALKYYNEDKYHIHIDSIYSGNRIVDFFTRTFKEKHIGKVIYKYQ